MGEFSYYEVLRDRARTEALENAIEEEKARVASIVDSDLRDKIFHSLDIHAIKKLIKWGSNEDEITDGYRYPVKMYQEA
jgi:Mg/Co/Ni transporter MgtE